MSSLAEALPGVLLVLGVPGVLILLLARVRMSLVEALAVVPIASIGAVWIVAEICLVLGIPFGAPAFFVLLAALLALVLVSVVRKRFRAPQIVLDLPPAAPEATDVAMPEPDTSKTGAQRFRLWIAFALLVVSVLIGGSTFLRGGMAGDAVTPPSGDSSVHGFMIQRIVRAETVAPKEILVTDPRGRSVAAEYYPFAVHAALAEASTITGASPAALLTGTVLLFAVLVLPFGLFALTRWLVPGLPLAAGFAAVLGQLLPAFPYKPLTWGGLTVIIGMSMLPVLLVVLLRALTSPWSRRALALNGLLLAALFSVYVSVVVVLLLLTGLLLLERAWLLRSVRWLYTPVKHLAVIGVVALVLSIPVLPDLAGGTSERSSIVPVAVVSFDSALVHALTISFFAPAARWLALLAAVGIGLMLWRRQLAAWAIGTGIFIYLAVLAAMSHGRLSHVLSLPWYRQPERISFNLVYFVPVFAAMALALACEAIGSIQKRWTTWLLPASVVLVLALAWGVALGASARDSRQFLQAFYQTSALRSNDVAAFRYLGHRQSRSGLILSDHNVDLNLWMYSFTDANPLFGPIPADDHLEGTRDFREREYLRDHLTNLGKDPKLDPLLAKYGVRYVYFGDQATAYGHTWSLAQLRKVPRLEEVFQRGTAHVFKIVPAAGNSGASE